MLKNIADHVLICITCQRYKPGNQLPLVLVKAASPSRNFETAAIDLSGSLPVTERK